MKLNKQERDAWIKRNMRVAGVVASRYKRMNHGTDWEDLYSVALYGLVQGASKWDTVKHKDKSEFMHAYAYARMYVHYQLSVELTGFVTGLRRNAPKLRTVEPDLLPSIPGGIATRSRCLVPSGLGHRLRADGDEEQKDSAFYASLGEIREPWLERYVGELPPRMQHIVRRHYVDGDTLSDVGREIGVSRQRMGQLRDEIVQKLRESMGIEVQDGAA